MGPFNSSSDKWIAHEAEKREWREEIERNLKYQKELDNMVKKGEISKEEADKMFRVFHLYIRD